MSEHNEALPDGMAPPSEAEAEAPASPSAPRPTISPDMSPAQAGGAVVAFHLARMTANEAGTREGADPEALHDMRVATRRLRAALRSFRDAFDPAAVAAFADDLRWLAALLGRVRDHDVFLLWLRQYHDESSGRARLAAEAAIDRVEAMRAEERVELLRALDSERYARLRASLEAFAATADGEQAAAEPLGEFAATAIRRQLRRVRRLAAKADGDPEALHAVRIACKRLRYTCEFLADLFPAEEIRWLTGVAVAIQDALGAMRDAQLQAAFIRQMAAGEAKGSDRRAGLRQIERALRRVEREQVRAYRKLRPGLMSSKARRRAKKLLAAGGMGVTQSRKAAKGAKRKEH